LVYSLKMAKVELIAYASNAILRAVTICGFLF
jgi:hypothetical protein